MKRRFLRALGLVLTCGIALVGLSSCGKGTPKMKGYNLLWADEFNDKQLDETKWLREVRPIGWTNNELQQYTESEKNGFIRNGKFVIKANEYDANKYSSCKLRNKADYAFKYGRVETSAKVPVGKGLWPAIWMMPKDENYYGQWPKCGEIDIMEVLGDKVETAYSTVHYGEPHGEQQGSLTLKDGKNFADGFHKFAVEWEPGQMEWFIDGISVLKVNDWYSIDEVAGKENPYPAPFNQEFCIQINLAVGGNWPGNPDPYADYMDKAEFEIDYVRVYQKESYDENVTKPDKTYRSPFAGGNYVKGFDEPLNADGDTKSVGWVYLNNASGNGKAEIIDGNIVKITTTSAGSEDYSIQFLHTVMPFIQGKKYKISFEMWADEPKKINEICIDAPNVGWARYWSTSMTLTTEKNKKYEYEFEMTRSSDDAARFEFNMGKVDTTTVYIANVSITEIE